MTKELSRDELVASKIDDLIGAVMDGKYGQSSVGGKPFDPDIEVTELRSEIIDLCQQSLWVPIEERQPAIGAYVDCTDGDTDVRTTYAASGFVALPGATHWMERPELPKKQEGL